MTFAMQQQAPLPAINQATKHVGDRFGETVLALPVETYGRPGDEAESTLWTLAQAAERAGGNGTASRIHRSWKTKLQRVVLRAVADVALLALHGCRPEGGSAEWG